MITSTAAALNWSGNGVIGEVPPQHRLFVQHCADSICVWPNAVGTFNRPLSGV